MDKLKPYSRLKTLAASMLLAATRVAARTIAPTALRRAYKAFTLVELLVVVSLIGILVALLLPAVQAAREAARRTDCANRVRQIVLAMLNHESAHSVFPTGGVEPWPRIEDYSEDGKPYSYKKQGLGWAFQVLPYLEENSVHDLGTTKAITGTPIGLYFCPSRRAPTQWTLAPAEARWLIDYAATTPFASCSQLPPEADPERIFDNDSPQTCIKEMVWNQVGDFAPRLVPEKEKDNPLFKYWGVIVRGSYFHEGTLEYWANYTPPVRVAHITDGTSNTSVVTEKWIEPTTYDSGSRPADDFGWSDGWDWDVLRLTYCRPTPDSPRIRDNLVVSAGSAHPAGVNTGLVDGSVRLVSYDVHVETFNRLGHRTDGEIVDRSRL